MGFKEDECNSLTIYPPKNIAITGIYMANVYIKEYSYVQCLNNHEYTEDLAVNSPLGQKDNTRFVHQHLRTYIYPHCYEYTMQCEDHIVS